MPLTLLARENFRAGQRGVATHDGVRHLDRLPAAYPPRTLFVIAREDVPADAHGHFDEWQALKPREVV